jgi:lysophospholipase L1-like esterase
MLSSAILASTLCPAQQTDHLYLKSGDKVVFYGDSITDQRLYTAIVEAFVATRYPSLDVSFINSGWGGDTVNGGRGGPIDMRLKRDVLAFNPNVVTVMLGMNDGAYRPATASNDEEYYTGYRHIVESLQSGLPGVRITAIKPSAYDNVTRTYAAIGLGDFEYNEVLRGYGMWIAEYAKTAHLDTADMNPNLVETLRKANAIDPDAAKTILNDRVHPSFAGHMILAEELLKAWGARPVVSEVALDGSKVTPKVASTSHAKVTLLSGENAITWTELDDALPLPFAQWQDMWDSGPVALVIKSSDITGALNQQILKIKGLHPGTYSVKIDDTSLGSYNTDQLARGINLALLKTPETDQAMKVYQLVVLQQEIHYDWWRNVEVPDADVALTQSSGAIDSLRVLEAGLEKKVHEMAQPVPHHFEVTLVQ